MSKQYDDFPTIPVEVLIKMIKSSNKFLGEVVIGSTTSIILKGNSYIGKRSISFRSDIEEIDYEYSIALAFKAGKLSAVTEWFETNKSFKEGAYVVSESKTTIE